LGLVVLNFDLLIGDYTASPCYETTASVGHEIFEVDCENAMTLGDFVNGLNECIDIVKNDELCKIALSTFEATYSLNLSQAEKDNILQNINVPCGGDQDEFDEEVKVLYLGIKLNLDDDQKAWLQNHQDILDDIFTYQINNTYPSEALNYFIWAMKNHGNNLDFYTDGYDLWTKDDGYSPPNSNFIEILDSYVPTINPSIYTPLTNTGFREGHEYNPPDIIPDDLRHGYNGDCKLLSKIPPRIELCDDSEEVLLGHFKALLLNPLLNRDLQNVATDYYNNWILGIGGNYFNKELNDYVLTNSHTINTVKDFGKYLNDELKKVNGKIDEVNWNDFKSNYVPKYSEGELHTGLQILINDTEIMYVYSFDDFNFNSNTKEWIGTFYFQTFDNFGMDKKDLLKSQNVPYFGKGFASWWLLQHSRNNIPFRTELRQVFKIKGNLNK